MDNFYHLDNEGHIFECETFPDSDCGFGDTENHYQSYAEARIAFEEKLNKTVGSFQTFTKDDSRPIVSNNKQKTELEFLLETSSILGEELFTAENLLPAIQERLVNLERVLEDYEAEDYTEEEIYETQKEIDDVQYELDDLVKSMKKLEDRLYSINKLIKTFKKFPLFVDEVLVHYDFERIVLLKHSNKTNERILMVNVDENEEYLLYICVISTLDDFKKFFEKGEPFRNLFTGRKMFFVRYVFNVKDGNHKVQTSKISSSIPNRFLPREGAIFNHPLSDGVKIELEDFRTNLLLDNDLKKIFTKLKSYYF